jgi:hypothetical protein
MIAKNLEALNSQAEHDVYMTNLQMGSKIQRILLASLNLSIQSLM